MRSLPAGSVDMVLTSPPYFRLRDYGESGQLGLEQHVDQWVQELRKTAAEISRVLTSTGTMWINLGDTYATHKRQGAPAKSLLLAPERVATALLADGWVLRNKIVWHKTNHMPTSVRDRLACAWEALYVFSRSSTYFFDLDAVRVAHTSSLRGPRHVRPSFDESWRGPNGASGSGLAKLKARGITGHPLGKNPGDVWSIGSSNYRGTHRATFPVALAAQAIRAGCPEVRCRECRTPWRRPLRRTITRHGETAKRGRLQPQCECPIDPEPGLVLDPFFGVGTTAVAAVRHERDWLGVEINKKFAAEAEERIAQEGDLQARGRAAA